MLIGYLVEQFFINTKYFRSLQKHNGKMKIPLLFILIPFVTFGQIQIGEDIDGEAIGDLSGTSISLSSDGNIVAIGAFDNDGNGTNSGHVRVYENSNGTWIQIGQDIDGEAIGDLSGISVSLSCDGSIVAIGASNNNNNLGHVRVYENHGGFWTQVGQDIDGIPSQFFFGRSVSLSCDGRIVAIGANHINTNSPVSGQVDVYINQGGTWDRIGNTINNAVGVNVLGTTVSLSDNGNVIAVGTSFDLGNGILSGHVRIYKNQGGFWVQTGQDISSQIDGDQYGREISLSGDGKILAVSSMMMNSEQEDIGLVSIYKEEEEENWVQIGDTISGEMPGDQFGRGLSLSSDGTIIAIGARFNNDNGLAAGNARIFQNEDNVWKQIGNDIDGQMSGDQAGISVSLSSDGTIIAVGSNLSKAGKGEVRIFDLNNEFILSVKESATSRFTFFPNPAPSTVTIELPREHTAVLQKITLYNTLGQRVFVTQNTTIDTSQFTKGIYILQVTTSEGMASKKLITF